MRRIANKAAIQHLPITLVEPLETNRSVLGLDVLVLPATSEAVMATQISGRPEVTQAIRLVQETRQQRGVVMYQAVFHPRPDGRPYGELKGVVSAVFRMDDVLTAALGPVAPQRLQLCLIDPQGRAGNQRLVGAEGCELQAVAGRTMSMELPVRFSDRFWEFRLTEGPGYRAEQRSWTAWATVALGLTAVGMLGVFLVVITGHGAEQVEAGLPQTGDYLFDLDYDFVFLPLTDRTHGSANHAQQVAMRKGQSTRRKAARRRGCVRQCH